MAPKLYTEDAREFFAASFSSPFPLPPRYCFLHRFLGEGDTRWPPPPPEGGGEGNNTRFPLPYLPKMDRDSPKPLPLLSLLFNSIPNKNDGDFHPSPSPGALLASLPISFLALKGGRRKGRLGSFLFSPFLFGRGATAETPSPLLLPSDTKLESCLPPFLLLSSSVRRSSVR